MFSQDKSSAASDILVGPGNAWIMKFTVPHHTSTSIKFPQPGTSPFVSLVSAFISLGFKGFRISAFSSMS
jgi:hypothetical protein